MTVREIGKALGSSLHARHLKSLGFRKTGSTFSRPAGSFIEQYNIQGSSWNSGEEPWDFYLNVYVIIHGVPPIPGAAKGFGYHAHGRSSSVLPDTKQRFEVTVNTLTEVADELAAIIARISEVLPSLIPPVVPRAKAGLQTPIPVPPWACQQSAS